MGVMDFLFGTEKQSEMEPRMKEARNFILDQMMKQYLAGPVNVPKYFAPIDQARYSGANSLLGSLGLDTVAAPSMQTEMVNGMNVYSSEPFQTEMEANFAAKYPAQYEYLKSMYMDPVTGERNPTATLNAAMGGGGSGGGGGGSSRDDGASRIPTITGQNYAALAQPQDYTLNYGEDDEGNVYSVGYGGMSISPAKADEIGLKITDTNPFDMSFSDHVGAMVNDVKDIKSNVVNDIVSIFSDDDDEDDDSGFLGIF